MFLKSLLYYIFIVFSTYTFRYFSLGGIERAPDDYKETHNLVLNPKNTQFGG